MPPLIPAVSPQLSRGFVPIRASFVHHARSASGGAGGRQSSVSANEIASTIAQPPQFDAQLHLYLRAKMVLNRCRRLAQQREVFHRGRTHAFGPPTRLADGLELGSAPTRRRTDNPVRPIRRIYAPGSQSFSAVRPQTTSFRWFPRC